MHIASRYIADAINAKRLTQPKVVYVSTDLTYTIAKRMWRNFALDRPNRRNVPFYTPSWTQDKDVSIDLERYEPTSMTLLAEFLQKDCAGHICFLDLASATGGDDWALIARLVTSLGQSELPHLVVVDSVEGLETFSGEVDAFGVETTRRGRIARLLNERRKVPPGATD